MPGLFLSLDGLDGTGKSTQCRLLAANLRGRGLSVTTCTDPGGTDLGAKLRELLLHGRQHDMSLRTEALLFMASRAELVDRVIRPALARGEVVISDRFTLANIVYQGHAGGLDIDSLKTVGNLATGGLTPDRTLVLDLPAELAVARRGRAADRMEARGDEFARRVRDGFLAEAHRRPDRIWVIDASPDLETVQASIRAAVEDLIPGG